MTKQDKQNRGIQAVATAAPAITEMTSFLIIPKNHAKQPKSANIQSKIVESLNAANCEVSW